MKKILIEKMVKFLLCLFIVLILIGGIYIIMDMNNNAIGIYQNYVDLAWTNSEGAKPTLKSFIQDYTVKTADSTLALTVNVDVTGNFLSGDYLQQLIDLQKFRTEGKYNTNDLRDLAKIIAGAGFNEYTELFSNAAPIEPYYITQQNEDHTEDRSQMQMILNVSRDYFLKYDPVYRAVDGSDAESTDIPFTYTDRNGSVKDINKHYGLCCNCGTSLIYVGEGLFDEVKTCTNLNIWAANHAKYRDSMTPVKGNDDSIWKSSSMTTNTTWEECNPKVGDLLCVMLDNNHGVSPHVEAITYIDSQFIYTAGFGSSLSILLDAVMGYDQKIPLSSKVLDKTYSASHHNNSTGRWIGLWHMGLEQ